VGNFDPEKEDCAETTNGEIYVKALDVSIEYLMLCDRRSYTIASWQTESMHLQSKVHRRFRVD
jgi:hypothetical protein